MVSSNILRDSVSFASDCKDTGHNFIATFRLQLHQATLGTFDDFLVTKHDFRVTLVAA